MKALIKFNNISISDNDLVRFCGEAERLVGTNGGFGDQAAMILGTNNYVTKMTTDKDIKVYETVKLPENLGIIVINSGEVAKKAFESKTVYNNKVESFKIGLRAIQEYVQPQDLTEVTQEMLDRAIKAGSINDEVRKVMQYGLNEIKRAEKFVSVLGADLSSLSAIGSLVRESQDDERTLYGCSTPKIDAMIENINKIEGVLGSQICGAGLGGSIMVFYDKTYDKTGDDTINALIKYSYDVVSFI